MSKNKQPERGTPEYLEMLRKEGEEFWENVRARGPADFEETGIVFGSEEILFATDAELFPNELEEYTPEERKLRLVPKKEK